MRPALPALALAGLLSLGATLVPRTASADEQAYILADNNGFTGYLYAPISPTTFNCPVNQVFLVHEVLVDLAPEPNSTTGGWVLGVGVWPNRPANALATPPASFNFVGEGAAPHMFTLGQGVPIQYMFVRKSSGTSWNSTLAIVVWGHCAAPPLVATLPWQNH